MKKAENLNLSKQFIYKSGFTDAESEIVLNSAIEISKLTYYDLLEVVTKFILCICAMNTPIGSVPKLGSLLMDATKKHPITFDELTYAFIRLAPYANASDKTKADLINDLATYSDTGFTCCDHGRELVRVFYRKYLSEIKEQIKSNLV